MKLFSRFFRRGQPPQPSLEAIVDSNVSVQPVEGTAQTRYMGILDSYGVSWSLEKAARDTLQNFFDSNNQTLDGVGIALRDEANGDHVVRIQNHATYDFRMLLHLGGTTKANDESTAGGIGEGAKVLALVLLRDYGFSQVRFGSQDWLVDFTMDDVPREDYTEKVKGLFASVSRSSQPINGNFVEFRTENRLCAEAFIRAKDLFYHSGNPDFQNPTLEVPRVGGFKFLGGRHSSDLSGFSSNKGIPKGNLYIAGQRRHFDAEMWDNVEYVSLWIHSNSALRRDRDRGLVTTKEVRDRVIPSIVSSASVDDLTRVIYALEPIWSEGSGFEYPVGPCIMEQVIGALAKKKRVLEFSDKYLAQTLGVSLSLGDALRAKGYVLCHFDFANIGMKTASTKLVDLAQHARADPTKQEDERIATLYDAILPLRRDRKEIWVFDRENEKSVFDGQYNQRFVWISRQVLHGAFNAALATYLHELDHVHGGDASSDFSYALTNTLGDVIETMISQPGVYQKLQRRWAEAQER